ncbi:MAG: hypothetical protein NTX88_05570 [Candidatus Atribacteria bacterium]|nr:hypothetical protein [Candidatus Atribacteria bacterium]
MKWDEFLKQVRHLPVIESEMLLTGMADPSALSVQLVRWTRAGKIIQVKRGVYLLSEIYRKTDVYEPHLASILIKPSYISLEKALEFHGLIPEGVPVYTSVTTKRPGRLITPVGIFDYRHLKPSLFWGYKSVSLRQQTAFIAHPEKALLDFFYLKKIKVTPESLEEMRLQNWEIINNQTLITYANRFQKPGILAAAKTLQQYLITQKGFVKL